ncbi:DgyrCDS3856 [Dimorphilus gyrociliatus]|uniref:Poly [ADP-ribose] polymerase n=1 Tax=Dimorphilus gyrociliatus TaxID=2664684 RepID=A0A7I8VEL4_9ANNE|nr:DgyrCDS3856 [Dimorphilus gyrociliatus]
MSKIFLFPLNSRRTNRSSGSIDKQNPILANYYSYPPAFDTDRQNLPLSFDRPQTSHSLMNSHYDRNIKEKIDMCDETPENWSCFYGPLNDIFETKPKVVFLKNKEGYLFNEMEKFFLKAWKDLSKESDANITVREITRIENPQIFSNYTTERKNLLKRSTKEKIKLRETAVDLMVPSTLRQYLRLEINEKYLFHGTSRNKALIITNKGFDNRVASSGWFGKGIYHAHSPKFSHHYTGSENPRYMFLSRVLLGVAYDSTSHAGKSFTTPPCKTCKNTSCENVDHKKTFDSIIGNGSEYVVYNGLQCYPEYLFSYDYN